MQYNNIQNIYKLKDWIRETDLVSETICMNPCEGASKIFAKISSDMANKENFKFHNLCFNTSEWAREYLLSNPQYMNYYILSQNPAEWIETFFEDSMISDLNIIAKNPAEWAGKIVKQKIQYHSAKHFLDLYYLFLNPSDWVRELILKYYITPVWYLLCQNPAEWAGEMIKQNPQCISWYNLSRNPAEWARKLLEQNPDKINYKLLCLNPAKWAGDILKKNPENIVWDTISMNSSDWVIDILEQNRFRIRWYSLSQNPHIFTYDYEFIRERMCGTIAEELMQNRFHPRNLPKFAGWGFEIFEEEDLSE